MTTSEDTTTRNAVGITEGIRFFFRNLRTYGRTIRRLREEPPSLVLAVDNQGFNVPLAKRCRRMGIRFAYYFPPHVSIYYRSHSRRLARDADLVLAPYREDSEIYREAGANVRCVGHPFADIVRRARPRGKVCESLGIRKSRVLGLLPGSRWHEIDTLLPVMAKAARSLVERYRFQVVVPVAHPEYRPAIERGLAGLDVRLVDGMPPDLPVAFDAAILASGTATLQAAIFGVPSVVLYRVSRLTFAIGRRIVNVESVAMPNILARRRIIPELLQEECTAENVVAAVARYMDDPGYRRRTRRDLLALRPKLGDGRPAAKVAAAVLELLSV